MRSIPTDKIAHVIIRAREYESGVNPWAHSGHRTGHGVGTELDEPPYLAPEMNYELAAGMVLAVEPKVALPGIGVIGIEDTLVIRDSGAEPLTPAPSVFIVI